MRKSFTTEPEALSLVAPTDKPFVEVWHQHDSWFGIRIMRARADGSITRRWIVRYRDPGGKDTKDSLGDAKRGTWDAARHRAMAIRAEAKELRAQGVGGVPTFADAFAAYCKARNAQWTDATRENYDKSFARMAMWWSRRCDRITADDAEQMYDSIMARVVSEPKNRKVAARTGVAAAAMTMRLAHAVFADLQANGKLSANPCGRLKTTNRLYGVKPHRRATAIPRDQLPPVWAWMHRHAHPSARDFLIIGILLAFRKGVIEQLSWDMIDPTTRTIIVPDTAKGNKSGETFALPIPDWLWCTILLPRYSDPNRGRWVIPSPRHEGRPRRDIRGALAAMQKMTGVRACPHDVRASAASLFLSTIKNPLLASRLLGHSNSATADHVPAVSAGYLDNPEADMREGMNRVCERLLELCDPQALAAWRRFLAGDVTSDEASAASTAVPFDQERLIPPPDWKIVD